MGESTGVGAVAVRAGGRAALLVAFVGALLLAVVGLAWAPAAARAIILVDYPLCAEDGAQSEPAAYGDRVVWVDQRANPSGWAGDIWMYDYATGEETQITNDAYEQSDPDIWGDWVVWNDQRNGNGDIYAKNVVTGEEIAVCTAAGGQEQPRICGDVIVWEDFRGGSSADVFYYRISTGEEAGLSSGDDRSPDVYLDAAGYVIAYQAYGDMYVYNIDTSQGRGPLEDIYDPTLVAGDDEFVCGRLEDDGSGGTELQLYRYSWTGNSVAEIVTAHEPYAEFRSISVSGNKVAYASDGDSGFKVWVHDWVQETDVAVSDNGASQYNPAISGDMVVWRDGRSYAGAGDNYYDIYTNRALPAKPSAITTTSASATLAKYGDAYTLTGKLESGGAGLAGETVVLQRATSASGTFTDTSVTAVVEADGSFALRHVPAGKTWYRASYAGGDKYGAATGAVVYALPRAWMSNPIASSVISLNQGKTVYGYLKPRHTASTYPVRIYKYRYVSGKWKAEGYVKAKAANYSTYTKYSVSLKLPYRGKWRLRAYHPADAGHAASWSSGYAYVTVK